MGDDDMARAQLPIAVVMERRQPVHPWDRARWHPVAALPWQETRRAVHPIRTAPDRETCVMSGLSLELRPDENDGYFENWVAPEPKVFILWHEDDGDATPVAASVSYSEGARMLDSGDAAGGLPMHGAIHQWLGRYLRANYRPRVRRGREHG
jgi:hypothetical protein